MPHAKNEDVQDRGHADGDRESGHDGPDVFLRRGDRDERHKHDNQQPFGRSEKVPNGHRWRPDVSIRSSDVVTISPSTPWRSSSVSPSVGPSTNAAVASASAASAVGATTVTLATAAGETPVRGSRMWCSG